LKTHYGGLAFDGKPDFSPDFSPRKNGALATDGTRMKHGLPGERRKQKTERLGTACRKKAQTAQKKREQSRMEHGFKTVSTPQMRIPCRVERRREHD
jgi:hypothetical protein